MTMIDHDPATNLILKNHINERMEYRKRLLDSINFYKDAENNGRRAIIIASWIIVAFNLGLLIGITIGNMPKRQETQEMNQLPSIMGRLGQPASGRI